MVVFATLLISLVFSSHAQAANIAFVGDSHSAVSYGFFHELELTLKAEGHRLVNGQAICGAGIDKYLSGGAQGGCAFAGVTHMNLSNGLITFPSGAGTFIGIKSLLQNSDAVIVQLGGNHIDALGSVGGLAQEMVRIVLSQNKKCIWIGPAALKDTQKCKSMRRKREKVNAAIEAALLDSAFTNEFSGRRCTYINSYTLTEANPSDSADCRHYADYSPWVKAIAKDTIDALSTH
jgi:hypothetical protein